ncbi:MAG TPA: hypothetical protein VGS80_27230 [Ktedonobacterales bacterium]|nr:hypothetical protein [Ktedonobacterales bacterium]
MLHGILTHADRDDVVSEVSDDAAAVSYLTGAPGDVVAVCSNRDADHHWSTAFFAVMATGERLVTHHRYLMRSTNPARMPDGLRATLAHRGALVLEQPV